MRCPVRYVLARATATGTMTNQGNPGWRYVGLDERGRELEVIVVEVTGGTGEEVLLFSEWGPARAR